MKTILLAFAAIWMMIGRVDAQPKEREPVYYVGDDPAHVTFGIIPNDLFWTPDSRYVIFQPDAFESVVTYAYDVQSNVRIPLARNPYEMRLTVAQQEHFRMLREYGYINPRGRNFLYLSKFDTYIHWESYCYCNLYAVGNLYQKMFMPLTLANNFELSTLTWSEDGSAFVIGANNYHGGLKSLMHIQRADYCGEVFCDTDQKFIGQVDGSEALFDLSENGQQVLFTWGGDLILWDAKLDGDMRDEHSYTTRILANEIIGAAFISDDDADILMVNEAGIVRYTLATGDIQIINATINSTWASWVSFSPDNQWAAVLVGEMIGREELYVLPVMNGLS